MEIDKSKNELRRVIRAKLEQISQDKVKEKSAAIAEQLLILPEVISASSLLIYVSKGNEVATHESIRYLIAAGKKVCVPNYNDALRKYVASHIFDFDVDLIEKKFGILEPKSELISSVPIENIEAFVIPGLAFDKIGNRLGRGRGCFDRLLMNARGKKIGLSYNFQLLNEIPTSEHDLAMDIIVTNNAVIRCRP